MPVSGYPLPTDRTDETPMDDNHPLDHNTVNQAVNELSEAVDVLQAAPPGDVTVEDLNAAIAAITPEDIGAIPDTQATIVLDAGLFLDIPCRTGSDPSSPPSGTIRLWGRTETKSFWVMNSDGDKTQICPPFVCPEVELGTEALVTTTTPASILTAPVVANATYDVQIRFGYEGDNVTTDQLTVSFTTPSGSKGGWTGQVLNAANTGTSGTSAYTKARKGWGDTLECGARGAGSRCSGDITGTLITTTAGNFVWRAALDSVSTAVPVKIYGASSANGDVATMTLTRVK